MVLGPSRTAIRTTILETTLAILNGLHGIVNWPANEDACREIAQRFQQLAGVQNIVGAVDGTLIEVRCPAAHAATFR
jgi:hypothetical protein